MCVFSKQGGVLKLVSSLKRENKQILNINITKWL